jgi:enterochelin esterase-like enzyme
MWPRANPAPAVETPGGRRGPRAMETADFDKNLPNVSAKSDSQIRLLWIACGADDGLKTVNQQLESWLKSKDVRFTGIEIPGYAHVWPLWRQNLAELAQLLFQPKGDRR